MAQLVLLIFCTKNLFCVYFILDFPLYSLVLSQLIWLKFLSYC
ncbi:hypothetical protein CLJ1_2465 [Pseudomonas paraeruginosa]|nr:hypothetical protein CLJ1_2465 [Pseudomonas aeruginosa]